MVSVNTTAIFVLFGTSNILLLNTRLLGQVLPKCGDCIFKMGVN